MKGASMSFSQPKCPNCKKSKFVEQMVDPEGSRYKITIVKCSSCDSAIAAWPQDFAIQEINQKLDTLLRKGNGVRSCFLQK